jgi:protein-tyrosine-phosphatase
MAAAISKAKLVQPDQDWQVGSAGTWAVGDQPATEKAQQVLSDRGIDLSGHRSRSVSRELLESYNLILTMERGHREALRVEFRDLAPRIYLLSEMIGMTREIRDPIGGTLSDFEKTAQELEGILTQGMEKISQLAQPS